jgi:hypothetical protein
MSLHPGHGVSGAGGSISIASEATSSQQGISTSSVANESRPDSIRLLTGSSSSDYSSFDGCISLTAGSASIAPGPIADADGIVGGFRWKPVG